MSEDRCLPALCFSGGYFFSTPFLLRTRYLVVFFNTFFAVLDKVLRIKLAVNTIIIPRSPFFAFCTPRYRLFYKHKMKCGRMSASMKWRCLGHLQPFSKAKYSLTAMAKKEVCPRDEIADPPGMAVHSPLTHFCCIIQSTSY